MSARNKRTAPKATSLPTAVWRLSSGQSLAEFAFGAGVIAPGLLGPRLARLFPVELESRRGGRKPAPERP